MQVGIKRHLLLGLGRAFGFLPSIERAVLRHDTPAGARGRLYSLLEQGGVYVDTLPRCLHKTG